MRRLIGSVAAAKRKLPSSDEEGWPGGPGGAVQWIDLRERTTTASRQPSLTKEGSVPADIDGEG